MNTIDRLVHMANQIAKNLETDDDPVGATAHHIQLYWEPRMKRLILGAQGLEPNALAAVAMLAEPNPAT
jgi:formate dehydrogenase subunit delta